MNVGSTESVVGNRISLVSEPRWRIRLVTAIIVTALSTSWVLLPVETEGESFTSNVAVWPNSFVDQIAPSIDVDSRGKLFVAWHELNTSSNTREILLAKSEDAGSTFSPPVVVNDNGSWAETPSVAVGGDDKIHVVWTDWRNDADGKWAPSGGIDGVDDTDIYYASSTNGGLSFSPNVDVSDDSGSARQVTSINARNVAVDESNIIHVTWTDSRSANDSAFYSRSIDGGISFGANKRIPITSAVARYPAIATDGKGHVYVAWQDRRITADPDIYLAKSADFGSSFSGEVKVNDDASGGQQHEPSIFSSSNLLGVVWNDDRLGGTDIFFSASVDNGSTFSSNIIVNDDFSGRAQRVPSIWINESDYIVAAWLDRRNTDRDIYFTNSSDRGFSFSQNQRVNDDVGSENQYYPSVTMDGNGYLYIAWQDFRNGNDWDIWFARAPAEISDLQPISLAFNPPSPVSEFTTVALNATIVNNGDRDAINAKAQFFYGDPSLGQQIGLNVTIPRITAGGTAYAEASWPATPLGFHEIFVVVDSENIITESNESNNVLSAIIEVLSPPPEVLPPDNLRTSASGNDIRLDWEPPIDISNVSHNLIYRAQDQREFDFSAPTYNTSSDVDPKRTNWTDTNAASPGSPIEYYYTVRTVSPDGRKSITGNTAGKWTRSFDSDLSSFSLPLEPFDVKNISWYVDNIPNTEFVRWMDSSGHWITHDSSQIPGVNDIQAEIGDGYEISLAFPTNFTFCGYPASMIRFNEGLGDSIAFRKSLTAVVVGDDVNLTWQAVGAADSYLVFRSETRSGLHNLSLMPTANITETYWTDVGVLGGVDEFYYAVIPADAVGRLGSSTYSIGVISIVYSWGSDTFALPLKPLENHSLDWYCDAVPDVAGMAYSTFGEWKYHAREKPSGIYDRLVQVSEGYQISISGNESRRYEFTGW
jgi:hypothetical protein